MRKAIALMMFLFVVSPVFAQTTRTAPALENSNVFQQTNTFAAIKIDWNSGKTYPAAAIVQYMNKLYKSNAGGNINHLPTDTMYWTAVSGGDGAPGADGTDGAPGVPGPGIGAWSSGTTYSAGAVASYMGLLYSSNAGGNLNHTPTDTMYWTEISGCAGTCAKTNEDNEFSGNQLFQSGIPEKTVLCTNNLTHDTDVFWDTYADYNSTRLGAMAVRSTTSAGCKIDGSIHTIGNEFSGGRIDFYTDVAFSNRGLKIQGDVTEWTLQGHVGPSQHSFLAYGSTPLLKVADGGSLFPVIEADTQDTHTVSDFLIDGLRIQGDAATADGTGAALYMHGRNLNHWRLSNLKLVKSSGTAPLWIDGTMANASYNGTLSNIAFENDGNSRGWNIKQYTDIQFQGQFWFQNGQGAVNDGSDRPAATFEETVNMDMHNASVTAETCGGYYVDPAGGDTWLVGTTYPANKRVVRTGVRYDSLVAGNVGHDPATDTAHAYWDLAWGEMFQLKGGNSNIRMGRTGAADGTAGCYVFQQDTSGNSSIDTSQGAQNGGEIIGLFSPHGFQIDSQGTTAQNVDPREYSAVNGQRRPVNYPHSYVTPLVDDLRRMGASSIVRYPNRVSNATFIGNLAVSAPVSAVGVTDEYGGTQAFTLTGNDQRTMFHYGSSLPAGTLIEAVVAVRPHLTIEGHNWLLFAPDSASDYDVLTSQGYCSQQTLTTAQIPLADANGWYWCRMLAKAKATDAAFDIYLTVGSDQDVDYSHLTIRVIPSGSESDQDAIKETVALTTYSPLCAANDVCTAKGPLNYSTVVLPVVDAPDDVATGDGAFYFTIPDDLNGASIMSVVSSVHTVGTTGTTDIQIAKCSVVSGSKCSGTVVDVLTTKSTIDSGESSSNTAATASVVNGSNSTVATGDVIRVDVDAISGTAPKGLDEELRFRKP